MQDSVRKKLIFGGGKDFLRSRRSFIFSESVFIYFSKIKSGEMFFVNFRYAFFSASAC